MYDRKEILLFLENVGKEIEKNSDVLVKRWILSVVFPKSSLNIFFLPFTSAPSYDVARTT